MAEKSMLWAAPAGSGDGTAAYTEDETNRLFRRLAKAAANQGVLLDPIAEFGSGSNKELKVAGTSSPVNVYAGDAIVQGLYYWNTATVTVAIPSPSGATRIDRVVLRASYSADTVRITRIPGTEGVGTPPAMTQTPGTTYDIPLARCSITTGGVITVTDEREFCHLNTKVATENIDDLAVTTAKINNDAVDDTKIGDRILQFYRRQGGSASNWSTPGTTDYTPGAVRMQAGAASWSGSAVSFDFIYVNFPTNLADNCIALANCDDRDVNCAIRGLEDYRFEIYWKTIDGSTKTSLTFYWFVIGAE